MKVKFKHNGKPVEVDFKIVGSSQCSGKFALIASSTKNLEILQQLISDSEVMAVRIALQKHLESKLKIPVDVDFGYEGYGFGFELDIYSILKQLK